MLAFFTETALGRALLKILAGIAVVGLLYLGFITWLHLHDKELLKGYVLESEKVAAEATAAEMERQRNAASQALSDAQKRQQADDVAQQAAQAQTDIEMADYEKKLTAANRRCLVDGDDIKFLQSH